MARSRGLDTPDPMNYHIDCAIFEMRGKYDEMCDSCLKSLIETLNDILKKRAKS